MKNESSAEALQRRMVAFGMQVVQLSAKLPRTIEATLIRKQLLRAGTSVAPNYAEARGAESKADFVHKLRLVLKELNETRVWLDMICGLSWLPPEKMSAIVAENQELGRIIAASIRTMGGFERN
jgi:four helix bundle protein